MILLAGLEFLQGNISGDTKPTFSFQFVQYPGILEGVLSHISSLILKVFFDSFVDPTTFVDQMASGGRLALIYVPGDNNIDMNHFLSHFGLDLVVILVIWWQICCEKVGLNSVALSNYVTLGRCLITLSCSFLTCQRIEEINYWFSYL